MPSATSDLVDFVGRKRFATIMADPPWQFINKTGKVAPEHKRLARYGTMKLDDKGVALRLLDFGGAAMDTQSPTGKLVLVVLAAIAEFERSLSRFRQMECISRARAAGKYRGRAPTAPLS